MSTANVVSPSKVLAQILVDANIVVYPGVQGQTLPVKQIPHDGNTQVFTTKMPDSPDQVVCLYDIAGKYNGRLMRGQTTTHPGIAVIVRSLNGDGYRDVCIPVTNAFDDFVPGIVIVDGVDIDVQSVYRTTDIISMGEEVGKRRQQWSINYRIAFTNF